MIVMPGLVPGIHVFMAQWFQDVDGRNKCGHDGEGVIPGEPQAREGDPLARSAG
jgi:hypothetical protein